MEKDRRFIINSRKYDGSVRRSWGADLIEETGDLLVFSGVFEMAVDHPELGVIRRGTRSLEYFWKERWYSVFRFHEPEGRLRNFYCNVNMPPEVKDGALDFVDLDLDLLVNPDWSWEILDEAEFEANARLYGYPREVLEKSRKSLGQLIELIETRDFPFLAETAGGIVPTSAAAPDRQ